MNYYEVLFHPTIILSTILYLILVISFETSYQLFLHKISHVTASHWIAKKIGTPFFHVILLVSFIYMTYPILYGLDGKELPTLSKLFDIVEDPNRSMMNSLFIISAILPLIPIINRFIALILPLQAIAGSAIVYSWMADYMDIKYSLFPSVEVLAIIVLFSLLAEYSAKTLVVLTGHSMNQINYLENFQLQDIDAVVYKSTLLAFQIPILLIYTLNLPN